MVKDMILGTWVSVSTATELARTLKELNTQAGAVKPLEGNPEDRLHNNGMDKDILGKTLKAQETSKILSNQQKKQPTG